MKKILLVIALINCICVYAQPTIQWQKCYGGVNSDAYASVIQTSDSGYIAVGASNSTDGDVTGNHGDMDIWVTKINKTGTLQWQKSYGGTGRESGYSAVQLTNGGYVIHSFTYSSDGDVTCGGYYWLIKISATGAIIWQKCFPITPGNHSEPPCLVATADNGVAFAACADYGQWSGGHGSIDFVLVKLDSNGNTQWHQCYGGSDNDYSSSLWYCADHGFLLAGSTRSGDGQVSGYHSSASSADHYDYWVIKADSTGSLKWQNCLGGLNDDIAFTVCETKDSGAIVAGYTLSNDGQVVGLHGGGDIWISKLSDTGGVQWSKCYGGTSYEYAWAIRSTFDGGYVFAGYTTSNDGQVTGNHGVQDYWVVHLNDTGAIKWQKCLGGNGSDAAMAVWQTSDSGYIVSGSAQSTDGNVTGNHGGDDFWIVKLSKDNGSAFGITDLAPIPATKINIFPNPATATLNVTSDREITQLTIFNLVGQIVYKGSFDGTNLQIDVSCFPEGMYFINASGVETRKFLKE